MRRWDMAMGLDQAVQTLQTAFTGTIATGLALVAIVVGGFMFAFGKPAPPSHPGRRYLRPRRGRGRGQFQGGSEGRSFPRRPPDSSKCGTRTGPWPVVSAPAGSQAWQDRVVASDRTV
jgi:hypothetical protein